MALHLAVDSFPIPANTSRPDERGRPNARGDATGEPEPTVVGSKGLLLALRGQSEHNNPAIRPSLEVKFSGNVASGVKPSLPEQPIILVRCDRIRSYSNCLETVASRYASIFRLSMIWSCGARPAPEAVISTGNAKTPRNVSLHNQA